jgi:hypothetical protein
MNAMVVNLVTSHYGGFSQAIILPTVVVVEIVIKQILSVLSPKLYSC